MSITESEFEWVEDADPPAIELYQEAENGQELLVAHEHLNPYGWLACSATMEVRR